MTNGRLKRNTIKTTMALKTYYNKYYHKQEPKQKQKNKTEQCAFPLSCLIKTFLSAPVVLLCTFIPAETVEQ